MVMVVGDIIDYSTISQVTDEGVMARSLHTQQAPGYQAPAYPGAPAAGAPGWPGAPGSTPPEPVVSIGSAFNYAIAKFQTNAREILLAGALCFLALVVLTVLSYIIVGAGLFGASFSKGGMILQLVSFPILFLIPYIGFCLFQLVIIGGSLGIVNGQTPLQLNRMFSTDQLGSFLLGALLVAVVTSIGYLRCIVPGLLIMFFSAYWGYFLIDKHLSPINAIRASFSFVNRNLGSLLLFFLASLILYGLGTMVCGVGLVIAIPLIIIAQGFMWRRLQGEPVAP